MPGLRISSKIATAFAGLVTVFGLLPAWAAPRIACERELVPTVWDLNLVRTMAPQPVDTHPPLSSPAVTNSWLALGRRLETAPDFMALSRLEPVPMSERQKRELIESAKQSRETKYIQLRAQGQDPKSASRVAQADYVREVIGKLFREETGLGPYMGGAIRAHLHLTPGSGPQMDFAKLSKAFDHTEKMWAELARVSPRSSSGSLLPAPFVMLIAGDRFKESYYWDSYFSSLGLIATGRWDLAAAQVENLLHMIQMYGHIPNGFRDYYLTRSQPPVIAMMVEYLYDHAPDDVSREKLRDWIVRRAYPLLQWDYHKFWMSQRYHAQFKLNGYSDASNSKRPERHSTDDEDALARTYRDVRAEAESGLDFTDAFMGEATQILPVGLNSYLYAYENVLARFAAMAGDTSAAKQYYEAAAQRRRAVNRYNWDEAAGVFRNYNMRLDVKADVVSSEMFAALYTGLATPEQARRVIEFAEQNLERAGGLRASTSDSGKQWDGAHGWAPFHMMAVQGATRYGHYFTARRWAGKWVSSLAEIYARTGNFFEKIDVERVTAPHEDDSKYPTQTGFLWTNASYVWGLDYLGFKFKE